jgi:hypothetical protein
VRIIALEMPARDVADEEFAPLAADEAARLWQLVQAGTVPETWFRVDRHEAVLSSRSAPGACRRRTSNSWPGSTWCSATLTRGEVRLAHGGELPM